MRAQQRVAWQGRGFRSAIFSGIESRRAVPACIPACTTQGLGGFRAKTEPEGHGRSFQPGRMPGMSQLLLPAAFGAASLPVRVWPRRDQAALPCRVRRILFALSHAMPLPSRDSRSVKSVCRGPPGLAGACRACPRRTALPARSTPYMYTYMAPLRPRFDERDKAGAAARRQRPRRAAKGRCGAAGGEAGAEVRRAV